MSFRQPGLKAQSFRLDRDMSAYSLIFRHAADTQAASHKHRLMLPPLALSLSD